ncbi:hypothetical protein [Pseudomonas putida]|uniref:Lipoprotein n=1 Tax=Pseudomonas putida TaxID=303 RepID=A0A8I1ECF8_PSEPU|nr:hypothetical protein [Pseudomonas putida]MBI6882971.1 hypothetical protein [Pseudomonas putida]
MSKKSTILKASAIIIAMAASNMALAGSCAATKAKEAAVYGTPKNVCGNITSTADISKNPYTYTSPNGGCDLGLSLPGLPNFGNGGGFSACAAVKAITGPMVATVNQGMQQATNDAVNAVGKEAIDTAMNAVNSGDIADLASKTYSQMGSPTTIEGVQSAISK